MVAEEGMEVVVRLAWHWQEKNRVSTDAERVSPTEGMTYAAAFGSFLLFLPLRSFFGTLRLDKPNSDAMPSSRRPRKSSPSASAKLPLRCAQTLVSIEEN